MNTHLSRLLVVLFVVLQGLLPLLHAHLGRLPAGHSGIHFHALPVAGKAPSGTTWLTVADASEPPAITAPTEHRGYQYWSHAITLSATHPTWVAASAGGTAQTRAHNRARRTLPSYTLPPALAPPATC